LHPPKPEPATYEPIPPAPPLPTPGVGLE